MLYNKISYAPNLILYYIYKTNRFQVAVRLFSNRSQRTSKCGKNISDTLGCASCATFLFLPHFDIICDLLLNRCTATWNLFVKLMLHSWSQLCVNWDNAFKTVYHARTFTLNLVFLNIALDHMAQSGKINHEKSRTK